MEMNVKNIFMNCEGPLLEISTNENKNVSCGIIPSDGRALKLFQTWRSSKTGAREQKLDDMGDGSEDSC